MDSREGGDGGAGHGAIVWSCDPAGGPVGDPGERAPSPARDHVGAVSPASRVAWRYDPDSGTFAGSDEFARLYGLDAGGGSLSPGRLVAACGYPAGERLEIALERAVATGAGFDLLAQLAVNGCSRTLRNVGRARVDDGAVTAVDGFVEDITATIRAQRRTFRAASTDAATGCANHLLLEDRLAMAVELFRRLEPGFALVLLAIEKRIDSRWQESDDADMAEIATRLAAVLRDSDTLARIAPDAFALVLPGAVEIGRIVPPLDRVQKTLRLPAGRDGGAAQVLMTCGVALFPKHGGTGEALMATAERALLQAHRARLTSDVAFSWSLGEAGGGAPAHVDTTPARTASGRG